MSQPVMLLFMLALLVPLWLLLHREFVSGLCYGLALLICLTPLLRIPTPGVFPELTIHRLVMLSLILFWLWNGEGRKRLGEVPLVGPILAWGLVAFVSLLGAVDYVAGTKRYLDYVLEFFLLYFILATSLRTREEALRILRAACLGLGIVAALAFAEKYSGVNVVDRFLPFGDEEYSATRDVRATYRHRILLGTGMAMGWPLAFYLSQTAGTAGRRRVAWLAMIGMLAACYFARSRGPWLAAVIAGVVIAALGSASTRRRLAVVGGLAAILLFARPGVFDTIFGLTRATLDTESQKGGTFLYRLELWRIATTEVSRSPWRTLFGYGPGAASNRSVGWSLSYREHWRERDIWSWDNDLAYALYQYGIVGLSATLVLYVAIPWRLLSQGRRLSGADRDLFVCLGASALVLLFMMSNVMIYARQLHYLLWGITALGFATMGHLARVRRQQIQARSGARAGRDLAACGQNA